MRHVDTLAEIWQYLLAGFTLAVSLFASARALLYKRDSRSATLWVGLIWILPLLGTLLYFLFGVNRIKRRAALLRGDLVRFRAPQIVAPCDPAELATRLSEDQRHLTLLASTTAKVLARPLLPGNRIDVLVNGDEAYPAMLEAIANARHSVTLASYIFDRDAVGLLFAEALEAAVRRGVAVRVLVDATGAYYSWPTITGTLRKRGIPHARFLPALPFHLSLSLNLRNHRKLLVVDGRVGFTGGMNLRAGHWLAKSPAYPVQDLHFRLQGPVVAHLQETFADDWLFTTQEALRGEPWFFPLEPCGSVLARGISDGPDEDFEKLRWTLLAALSTAKRSVRIATPYFLPEPTLIAALNLAAMRGATVDILLPARGNLRFVEWASMAMWWQVLERGCRIWLSPPPFDHSKLFVIDDTWTLVGSTNWDPRSLRLNFEFNVECYDPELARTVTDWFERQRLRSREMTLEEIDDRSLPVRLRDSAARLFSPLL
jgi:cardiolipin synthase